MMDTVLFTDHDILVFVITTTAAALLLSVLGLATTQQIRSDMKDQFQWEAKQQAAARKAYVRLEADRSPNAKSNEWASVRDEFNAAMRGSAESLKTCWTNNFVVVSAN